MPEPAGVVTRCRRSGFVCASGRVVTQVAAADAPPLPQPPQLPNRLPTRLAVPSVLVRLAQTAALPTAIRGAGHGGLPEDSALGEEVRIAQPSRPRRRRGRPLSRRAETLAEPLLVALSRHRRQETATRTSKRCHPVPAVGDAITRAGRVRAPRARWPACRRRRPSEVRGSGSARTATTWAAPSPRRPGPEGPRTRCRRRRAAGRTTTAGVGMHEQGGAGMARPNVFAQAAVRAPRATAAVASLAIFLLLVGVWRAHLLVAVGISVVYFGVHTCLWSEFGYLRRREVDRTPSESSRLSARDLVVPTFIVIAGGLLVCVGIALAK